MSPEVNRMVAEFRRIAKIEFKAKQDQSFLDYQMRTVLYGQDLDDYIIKTQEIDEAIEHAIAQAEMYQYSPSTKAQLVVKAANQAGLDHELID